MKLLNSIYRLKSCIARIKYKVFFGKRFKCSKFSCRNRFNVLVENTGMLKIGRGVFFNNGCSITCLNHIEIGDNCLFGEDVKIYDHNHKFRDKDLKISTQGYSEASIIIGDNCWIGSNVTILKNARIGNHVVVGAGCVIDQQIPDNTIVKQNRELILTKIN